MDWRASQAEFGRDPGLWIVVAVEVEQHLNAGSDAPHAGLLTAELVARVMIEARGAVMELASIAEEHVDAID